MEDAKFVDALVTYVHTIGLVHLLNQPFSVPRFLSGATSLQEMRILQCIALKIYKGVSVLHIRIVFWAHRTQLVGLTLISNVLLGPNTRS